MTQINQNSNNIIYNYPSQQNVSTGSAATSNSVRIPDYYVVADDKKSLREQIKSNPLTSLPYEFCLRGTEHPIETILTWLGLSFALDEYQKASGGKYESSLLKKVSNFGDKVENSNFVKSEPIQFILKGFKKIKHGGEKVADKSAILKAMKNTPSMPEWPMVKQEMLPHRLKVCEDFFNIANTLHLADEGIASLKDLSYGSKEKAALKNFFNVSKISQISEDKAVNYILLKQIGKDDNEIKNIFSLGSKATEKTKDEIRKTLNNISKETLKSAHEHISNGDMFGKHYNTVLEATKAGAGKVKIRAGHYGFLGPLTRPFERVIACDEIYNKLWSMSDGAKTGTGRFLSKLMQMTHRGLTFGQGKLGLLLLIVPSLVEVGRDVVKADPDQKVGTAANGFVESISWVFTFPAALHIMHAFGGVQYAGMTKKQVGEYRNIMNEFNMANKNGKFKTKAQYDKAKKIAQEKLKKLYIVKNQNFFTKMLRKFARIFTMDLETFKAYEGQSFLMKKLHQMPNFFKNCFGVPVRFGVWSAISIFALGGLLTKATALLFGKAYDSMKHEEDKENKKAQKKFLKEDLNDRLYKLQAQKVRLMKVNANRNITKQGNQLTSKGRPDVNQYYRTEEEKIDNYTYIPSSENIIPSPVGKGPLDTYTYIPSSENNLQKNDAANPNARKYVPSQTAANIQKNWDNSGLEDALRRADNAESKALKILAGNFEGMV